MAKAAVAAPMSRVTLVVLAVLAVTALAGCSKAPPSGELAAGASAVAVSGDAMVTYVAKVRPASAVPNPALQDALCSPAPQTPPQTQCVDPSSSFKVHFMALPTPEGEYEVVLANSSGILPLGMLAMDANNMYELNKTLDKDYTGAFDRLELRMGDFVFATAPTAAGANPFALADGLSAVSATGTFKGKVLNVTVSGLPAAGSFVGRLYTCDPESKLLTSAETFPVHNGGNEFTAPLDIAEYAEFHIHVGTSLINLYKTTTGPEPSGCTSAPAPAAAAMG
jgi:hypothetical protein